MWGGDMHYVFLFILVSNIFPPPFISVPVLLPVPVRVLAYARMRYVMVRLVVEVVGVRLCPRGGPAGPVWGWVPAWVGVWVRRACGGDSTRTRSRLRAASCITYNNKKSIN